MFLDEASDPAELERAKGHRREEIAFGEREIFVHYPDGIGESTLVLASAKQGTGRNLATVAKLAGRAADP